jgi:hypothetical protein
MYPKCKSLILKFMETNFNNISIKSILITIGAGIWLLVLQNAGIIPKLVETEQRVYVQGGSIDAEVTGSVTVDNTVDVTVDNTVDINIEAVNGYSNAFYGPSKDGTYDAIHVYTGK